MATDTKKIKVRFEEVEQQRLREYKYSPPSTGGYYGAHRFFVRDNRDLASFSDENKRFSVKRNGSAGAHWIQSAGVDEGEVFVVCPRVGGRFTFFCIKEADGELYLVRLEQMFDDMADGE